MAIEVDNEKLCDHCEDSNEHIRRDTCEGGFCEEAIESYLDENGIVDTDDKDKTFADLRVGDTVSRINLDNTVPVINKVEISGMYKENSGSLKIDFESSSFIVAKDLIGLSVSQKNFVSYKECRAKAEEICIKRIVELSKAIGTLTV